MNICFIVTNYDPFYSANGIVAKNIIDILRVKNNISVISIKNDDCLKDFEIKNGISHYRVVTKEYDKRNKLKKSKKIESKISLPLIKANRLTRTLMSKTSVDSKLIDVFSRTLEKLSITPDIIIPLCFPMEGVVAAINYKKKFNRVKVTPFFIDNFSDSISLNRFKWNKKVKYNQNLLLEKWVINHSDILFATKDWLEHLNKEFSECSLISKIILTELPSFNPNYFRKNNKESNNSRKITYSGSFISKIRPADDASNLISNFLSINKEFHFQFIHRGNGGEVIKKLETKFPDNITDFGLKTKSEADEILGSSDILLSIGNKTSSQTPSKIFEYMSMRLPILHLSYVKDDPTINILNEYEGAFVLNLNKYEQKDLKDMEQFLNKSEEFNIEMEELVEKFKEYSPNGFIKKMETYLDLKLV